MIDNIGVSFCHIAIMKAYFLIWLLTNKNKMQNYQSGFLILRFVN